MWLFLIAGSRAQVPTLECSLTAPTSNVVGKAVPLTFTVKNTGASDLSVLDWSTPLEGIRSPMLRVIGPGGKDAEYRGILLRRADPVAKQYRDIASSGDVSATVDLTEGWVMEAVGEYEVVFERGLRDVIPKGGSPRSRSSHESSPLTCRAKFTLAGEGKPKLPVVVGQTTPYANCTADQETSLPGSWTKAGTIATTTNVWMTSTMSASDNGHYVTWFGDYANSTVRSTATTNVANIQTFTAGGQPPLDCAGPVCGPTAYGYVFPTDSTHTIHLCSQYWAGAVTDVDARQGTLLHEASHFSDVAGTDDHAYGRTDCKNLAKSDPSEAADNADNYTYFFEDVSGNGGGGCCNTSTATPSRVLVAILLLVPFVLGRRRISSGTS